MTHFSITLIFHGAEVFDSGDAARLIHQINPNHSLVAGVMARTAAAESGLPVTYDGRKPSEILIEYLGESVVLVHRAKTPASAHRFGSLISSHISPAHLIMIEPATSTILTWENPSPVLISWLSQITGYVVTTGAPLSDHLPDCRTIGGCLAGEPVFINGIIIGYATGEKAVLGQKDGEIIAISGIELKEHGVEKLMKSGFPDLHTAWCKSGTIRNHPPKKGQHVRNIGYVEVIDHQAAACYGAFKTDVCGLLTIGDDTTSICGHIGCSIGIPVLGITDGDIDGIIPEGYAKGSVILCAISERDDDVGAEVVKLVSSSPVDWDEWVYSVIRYLGNRVRVIHRE